MLSSHDRVVVHVRRGCTVCARVMRFLDELGVSYSTREVDEEPFTSEELWRLLTRKGNRLRVPFTSLNDGEDVVLGYDPIRLESVFTHGRLGGGPPDRAVTDRLVYDDFSTAEVQDKHWRIAEMPLEDGSTYRYSDENAQVESGNGYLEVTVHPFTAFHDTVQVLNNPKQLYLSRERIATPRDTVVDFEVGMAVRTYGQIPFSLRDAFGTLNLIDFTTGMVLDFAATNDTVFVVYERLLIPGATTPEEYFAHRVVLEVDTGPEEEHHYQIRYDRNANQAEWFVDGERLYWASVPIEVEGFNLGMGLFSSLEIDRYTRAERERGQGATGRWSPWVITSRSSS